jgi:hypothetical protein
MFATTVPQTSLSMKLDSNRSAPETYAYRSNLAWPSSQHCLVAILVIDIGYKVRLRADAIVCSFTTLLYELTIVAQLSQHGRTTSQTCHKA